MMGGGGDDVGPGVLVILMMLGTDGGDARY